MTEKEQKLHDEIQVLHAERAEMEGDVRTTMKVFVSILKMLNISADDFKGGQGDIMSKLPVIISRVSTKLITGNFDMGVISDIQALAPVIEKYKYLTEDITL